MADPVETSESAPAPKPVEPEARLTELKDINEANTYIAYEFLLLLSSAYTAAMNSDYDDDTRKLWGAAIDSTLEDLGDTYELWQRVQDDADYGMPILENQALKSTIRRSTLRIKRAIALFSPWRPLLRVPGSVLLWEKTWGKIAVGLSKDTTGEAELFGRLEQRHSARLKTIKDLSDTYRKRHETIRKDYYPL